MSCMLKAFKDELGLKAPMNLDGFVLWSETISAGSLLPAMALSALYTPRTATAKYGPVQPIP